MANSNKFKNDKYYTPQEIVDTCFDILLKVVDDKDISRVIEPSAGNGSFIHKIKESFPNADKIYLDLYPESDDIIRQDFLEYNLEYSKNTLVIGNPPFGSRGSGFVKFFNKAIEFADYVAFILPISQFENPKRLYKFDLISSTNLGKIDFYYRNEHKSVKCCFNIYKRPDSGLRTTKKTQLNGIDVFQLKRSSGNYINPNYYASDKCIRLCAWGRSLGYISNQSRDAYANEILVKSENNEVIEFVKSFNWKSVCSKTAALSLCLHRVKSAIALKFPDLVINDELML